MPCDAPPDAAAVRAARGGRRERLRSVLVAAVPSALILGMGVVPGPAQADGLQPPYPFRAGPCVERTDGAAADRDGDGAAEAPPPEGEAGEGREPPPDADPERHDGDRAERSEPDQDATGAGDDAEQAGQGPGAVPTAPEGVPGAEADPGAARPGGRQAPDLSGDAGPGIAPDSAEQPEPGAAPRAPGDERPPAADEAPPPGEPVDPGSFRGPAGLGQGLRDLTEAIGGILLPGAAGRGTRPAESADDLGDAGAGERHTAPGDPRGDAPPPGGDEPEEPGADGATGEPEEDLHADGTTGPGAGAADDDPEDTGGADGPENDAAAEEAGERSHADLTEGGGPAEDIDDVEHTGPEDTDPADDRDGADRPDGADADDDPGVADDAAGQAPEEPAAVAPDADDPFAPDAAGRVPYPCPEEREVPGTDEVTAQVLPDAPWLLEASHMTLRGLEYHGVVNVRTGGGAVKQALKFTATAVDVGDLHQIVRGAGGLRYHVRAADGSTSTFRETTVTMYTERLEGNLFGLIPVVFDPRHEPLLDLGEAYFTDVRVTQAGQFGGTLTVPGMRQYMTHEN